MCPTWPAFLPMGFGRSSACRRMGTVPPTQRRGAVQRGSRRAFDRRAALFLIVADGLAILWNGEALEECLPWLRCQAVRP